jgi:hypothetical protein
MVVVVEVVVVVGGGGGRKVLGNEPESGQFPCFFFFFNFQMKKRFQLLVTLFHYYFSFCPACDSVSSSLRVTACGLQKACSLSVNHYRNPARAATSLGALKNRSSACSAANAALPKERRHAMPLASWLSP